MVKMCMGYQERIHWFAVHIPSVKAANIGQNTCRNQLWPGHTLILSHVEPFLVCIKQRHAYIQNHSGISMPHLNTGSAYLMCATVYGDYHAKLLILPS
jgi:hypothetical protein